MKLKLNHKKEKNKKLVIKIVVMVLLFVILVADIIYTSILKRTYQENYWREEAESTEVKNTEEEESNSVIKNLDEFAAPMLKENTKILEESLLSFLPTIVTEDLNCEIIHVAIPDVDANLFWFFLEVEGEKKFVLISYDREKKEAETSWTEYTKSEILDEVWTGYVQNIRDVQE